MRHLTALLLSLLMAVTSVTMAMARVAEPMGPTLTLCSDQGTVEVVLDAQGNPVAPHLHLCPDCLAAHVALDLPAAPDLATPPLGQASRLALPVTLDLAGRASPTATARGPPGLFV